MSGPRRQHRGRRKVPVTLLPSKRYPWERQVEMDVSPHLKIRVRLVGVTSRAVREGTENLEALYGFAVERSWSYGDGSRTSKSTG